MHKDPGTNFLRILIHSTFKFKEQLTRIITLKKLANCPCPQGYVPDQSGNNCVRATNSPATTNGTFYTSQFAGPYPYWGNTGTNFYQDISALPFPLGGNGTNILDASSAIVPVVNNVQSPLWGQFMNIGGPYYGRQNVCGLWTTLPQTPSVGFPGLNDYPPIGEWIGFSTCVTVPTTGTYCIGMSADNCLRFKIDGVLIAQLGTNVSGGYPFNFNYWHVFPITLSAGQHIVEMEGLNQALVAFYGAEIYNATPAQLAAMTTPAQLSAVTVFSTVNEIGQPFSNGENSGYSCGNGCAVNLCGPSPQCTCYDVIARNTCCFRLTNCVSGAVIITNTDVSANVGQVISIQGQTGCWAVSTAIDCGGAVAVVVTASYASCVACLPCFLLTNCDGSGQTVQSALNLGAYVGQIVQIGGYPGVCWTVSTSTNCGQPVDVQITASFADCTTCSKKCYLLVDCAGVETNILTNTDLSAYLGDVIKIKSCPDVCWTVQLSDTCVGAIPVLFVQEFETCALCNPPLVCPPPELLRQRKVKPGYDTPGCSREYTEKVNCEFAEQIYTQVKKRRYGISPCCDDDDFIKWSIKKDLLDLRAIWDLTLCVTCAPISCCTPCPAPAPLVPPTPIACQDPTNVSATIVIIDPCPLEGGSASAQITFNNKSTTGFQPPIN